VRKVLISSGDSWTAGSKSSAPGVIPDSFPYWPEILANKLDMDFVNVGAAGIGNEFIYNHMIDKLCTTKRIGLAICLWTTSDRLRKHTKKQAGTDLTDRKYNLLKSMRWYHAFQNHCELHNIQYLQMQAFHSPKHGRLQYIGYPTKELLNSAQFNLIDDKKFIGWPMYEQLGGKNAGNKLDDADPDRTKLRVSREDSHPNDKGHEYIAEIFYDTYKEIYL
jgi:hypothetical protein